MLLTFYAPKKGNLMITKRMLLRQISLLLIFSIITFSTEANTLIVIQGTANSGKSSLCQALNNLDNSYKIISQDDINRKATYEVCEKAFPEEMAVIRKTVAYENMWQAIKCFNVIFIPKISEEEKQNTLDAISLIQDFFDDSVHHKELAAMNKRIKHRVMEQLLFYAAVGYNIILDSWGYTNWDYELDQVSECFNHIIKVATYCSLETVIKRWKKRNEEAIKTNNYKEKRFLGQMLKSFFGFLEPSLTDQSGVLILTKKDFDMLIEKAIQCIQNFEHKKHLDNSVFSSYEFTYEELLDFKEKMYTKFDFDNVESVIVRPSMPHDMVLCTEGECKDYASNLLKIISSQFILIENDD
jgi:deoxyadenosine/deoxycytidine kinase